MKKILVVGGAGYIGSHMVLELLDHSYTPVVFDNLSTGTLQALPKVTFIQGDLLDPSALENLFVKHTFEAVMHFAALTEVGLSGEQPELFYRHNVIGSLNLFDAMLKHKVSKLIFSSSAAIYGNNKKGCVSEQERASPINPYGKTKWIIEEVLKDYVNSHGWKVTTLRYFNAAGCDSQLRTGIYHKNPTLVIPVALKAALYQCPFTIFGTDYPTPDGTCVRDFIHVSDLCVAHRISLEALLEGAPGEVYNLGAGIGSSIREVLSAVRKLCPNSFEVNEGPRRAGDPALLIADISRAQSELNWKPKHSSLEEVVEDTYRWYSRTC